MRPIGRGKVLSAVGARAFRPPQRYRSGRAVLPEVVDTGTGQERRFRPPGRVMNGAELRTWVIESWSRGIAISVA